MGCADAENWCKSVISTQKLFPFSSQGFKASDSKGRKEIMTYIFGKRSIQYQQEQKQKQIPWIY